MIFTYSSHIREKLLFKHDHPLRSETLLTYYFRPLATAAAAAATESLQSCLTLCDPKEGSPPGSPYLGFSRQEHWSGLPFPSPMHESEKWEGSRSVMADSSRPHGLQPPRLLRPLDSPGKRTGVGCHCLLHHLPHIWLNAVWCNDLPCLREYQSGAPYLLLHL